jgi:protein ECT2
MPSESTSDSSTGDDSLAVFSHQSNSTATAATSVSMSDDETFFTHKALRSRKVAKKGKLSAASDSDPSPTRRGSRATFKSKSANNTDAEYSDQDDDKTASAGDYLDEDLVRQLELARQNSQNHSKPMPPLPLEKPFEDTIYEGM